MKIREGFLLRELAGEYLVVPVGTVEENNFRGMIQMNKIGAFLWNTLTTEHSKEELLEAVLAEYEVEKEQAEKDVDRFIEQLSAVGILVV